MTTAQSAICAEGSNYAIFVTFNVTNGGSSAVRRAMAKLPALTRAISGAMGEPALHSAIGVGASAWDSVMAMAKPRGLVPFEPLAEGDRVAPATPADLFLHIHSTRHDANLALAREFVRTLAGGATLVEEVMGFRHLGGRDLTGFVDGTENAQGDERPEVALVPEGQDFAGGSFVSIQRYVHDLSKWSHVPVPEQEKIIGRTKEDDLELDDDVKPASAHIARVVIEEGGEELQVLRQSLPYGNTSEQGLYFVAYGATPGPFRRMLKRMVVRDKDGTYDHMLQYTKAVTGASFFVPSVDLLEKLG